MSKLGQLVVGAMLTTTALCNAQTLSAGDLDEKLFAAAGRADAAAISVLLDKGARVNARHKTGDTPLMVVIGMRNTGLLETMQLLIDRGADVNARNHERSTVLMAAARNVKTEAVRLLVANGAEVNETDRAGDTALMLAIRFAADIPPDISNDGLNNLVNDVRAIAQAMLARGADPEIKNEQGETAITLATHAWWRSRELLDLLRARNPAP